MDSPLYKRYKPLCDYFHIKDGNASVYRQFALMWEYAREKSNHGSSDACMQVLVSLSHRIGSPAQGEKPWSKLVVQISTENHLKALEALEHENESNETPAQEQAESVVESIKKALNKAVLVGAPYPVTVVASGGGSLWNDLSALWNDTTTIWNQT